MCTCTLSRIHEDRLINHVSGKSQSKGVHIHSNPLYGRNQVYTAHVYTYAIPICNTDRNRGKFWQDA